MRIHSRIHKRSGEMFQQENDWRMTCAKNKTRSTRSRFRLPFHSKKIDSSRYRRHIERMRFAADAVAAAYTI